MTKTIHRTTLHKRTGQYKGQNGRLLIVGGSKDYVGCLAMAGIAALRCGCDTVTIAAPDEVAWAINSLSADLITKKFPGSYFSTKHIRGVSKLLPKADAVLIGNGIGNKSGAFVRSIVKKIDKPCIVDAEALHYVKLQDCSNCLLTPHAGEFEILLKNSKLTEKNFQKHLDSNVLLLKGAVDKIYTKDSVALNKTGNNVMTKAGTGDVLAGVCSGLLAQGYTLSEAAMNAAFIVGKTGDYLKEKKGATFLASELSASIERCM